MATDLSNEATASVDSAGTKPAFLRRVQIRGYKSIAFCDVTLEPLTILVGRNGSGKSNFVDALAFLRDAMESGVAEAVKRRGGWRSVCCRDTSTNTISIDVEIQMPGRELTPLNSWNGAGLPAVMRDRTFQPFHFDVAATYIAAYSLTVAHKANEPTTIKRESLTLFEGGRD